MRQITNPIIILALNIDTVAKELKLIQDWGFAAKPVDGVYKGKHEQSYVLEVKDTEHLNMALQLAWSNGQECVLYADDSRKAKLIYYDGTEKRIGTLQPVDKQVAELSDGYTYDDVTKSYWIAK